MQKMPFYFKRSLLYSSMRMIKHYCFGYIILTTVNSEKNSNDKPLQGTKDT